MLSQRPGGTEVSAALLSASHLTVKFGGLVAVNDVSFEVQRGEVFTLIGPNGAGKTTVFNLISRIYQPTAAASVRRRGPDRAAAARGGGAGHRAHLPEHRVVRVRQRAAEPADRPPHPPPHRRCGRTCCSPAPCAVPRCRPAHKAEEVIDFLDLQHHRDPLVGGLALWRAQGGRTGARAVRRAEAAAAGRAVVGPERRGDRRHGLLDPGHPARPGHHRADGRARHDAWCRRCPTACWR